MVRCGVDLVDVARIRAAVEKNGDRFLERVFTREEIAYCTARRDPFPHYAARFAFKEALYKSLPAGAMPALVWNEIGIRHDASGAPEVDLRGEVREALAGWRFAVSLSHTRDLAIAQVLATPTGSSVS